MNRIGRTSENKIFTEIQAKPVRAEKHNYWKVNVKFCKHEGKYSWSKCRRRAWKQHREEILCLSDGRGFSKALGKVCETCISRSGRGDCVSRQDDGWDEWEQRVQIWFIRAQEIN